MFLGHFALGLAAKRVAPAVSLAVGKWGFAGVILLLLAIHLGAVFGPSPTSVAAVAWSAQDVWLLVLLRYLVDRHRYATVALPRARA